MLKIFNIKFLLVMMTAFSMTACVSTGPKFHVKDVHDTKFSERAQTPKITKLSESSLIKKGLLRIGTISAEEVYKTCYPGSDCSVDKNIPSPLNDMLEQARKKGADFVVVHSHNAKSSKVVYKNGKCDSWGTKQVPQTIQECISYNQYGCVSTRNVTKWNNVSYCTNYEKIRGTAYSSGSLISLWRKGDDTKKALELQNFMKNNAGKMALEIFNGKAVLFEKALQLGLNPDITFNYLLEYLKDGSPQRKKVESLPNMWIFKKFNKSIFERTIYEKHYEILRLGFEYGLSPDREVAMGGEKTIEDAIMKTKNPKMITLLKLAK